MRRKCVSKYGTGDISKYEAFIYFSGNDIHITLNSKYVVISTFHLVCCPPSWYAGFYWEVWAIY